MKDLFEVVSLAFIYTIEFSQSVCVSLLSSGNLSVLGPVHTIYHARRVNSDTRARSNT